MIRQFLFPALVTMVAASCKVVGNLYPLSRNVQDQVFKKELLGKWGDSTDPSGYFAVDTVAGEYGRLYRIEVVMVNKLNESPDTSRFLANLVTISGWNFLDCRLDLENQFRNKDKSYEGLLLAPHFIFRVVFEGANQLELAGPSGEELIKLIDRKKILLKYEQLNKDLYLITDKPAVLQKAFAESRKYPALYPDKNVLRRSE